MKILAGRYFQYIYRSILPVLLLLLSYNSHSQERCGTVMYQQSLQQLNPNFESTDIFESWMQERRNTELNDFINQDTVYTIPVVVHIIHNGEPIGTGYNLAEEQILAQIEVLNEDFRRLNADTIETPDEFKTAAIDSRFEFVLAKQDPDGVVTDGILRIEGTKNAWSISDNIEMKALSYWPAEDYLNIWVAPLANNLLGYAQFPISSLPGLEDASNNRLTDGVVIASTAFGSRDKYPAGSYDNGFDKGRTATHEIGHFLGLRHVSGDGGCNVDDYCVDTPTMSSDYGSLSNCTHPAGNTCDDGPGDLPDMFQNYMSLAQDPCMNLYTMDQTERMEVVILNSPRRSSLLSSPALQAPPPTDLDLAITEITSPLNFSCNSLFSPEIIIRNLGAVEATSARITLSINGVQVEDVNWTGSLSALDSTIVQFAAIQLAGNSENTFLFEIVEVNGAGDDNPDNDQSSIISIVPPLEILPKTLDFESGIENWTVRNPDSRNTWEIKSTPLNGASNSSLYIDLYSYNSALKETDLLVSPLFDISQDNNLQLTFDVSHAKFPGRADGLLLAATLDCGNTFQDTLYYKTGDNLATVSSGGNEPFTPTSSAQWRTEVIDLSKFVGNTSLQLAFISVNAEGNNIYLDNIRLKNQLIEEVSISESSVVRPSAVECDPGFSPSIMVQNTGTETITSFRLSLDVPELSITQSEIITTSLAVGETNEFSLPSLQVPDGSYEVLFEISEPNGNAGAAMPMSQASRVFIMDSRTDFIPLREEFEDLNEIPWLWIDLDPSDVSLSKVTAPSTQSDNTAITAALYDSDSIGSRHWIVSPVLDFSQTNEASLFFNLSYASRMDRDDRLTIYVISECTAPVLTAIQTLTAQEMANGTSDTPWQPANEGDWRQFEYDLSAFTGNANLRIVFEVTNDGGNNLYLDDIELFVSNNLSPVRPELTGILLYPNPSVDGNLNISVNFDQREDIRVTIMDPSGRVIRSQLLKDALNQTFPVSISEERQGLYLFKITSGSGTALYRVFR